MFIEKYYWPVIIFSVILFATLVTFVLIPLGIISNDLGINLVSESIGILFTVTFLSWLTDLKKRQEWNKVTTRVNRKINFALKDIIDSILRLGPISTDLLSEEVKQKRPFTRREYYNRVNEIIHELRMLNKAPPLMENLNLSNLIDFSTEIESRANWLSDIELKYSEFLDPVFLSSIIDIQEVALGIRSLLDVINGLNPDIEEEWVLDKGAKNILSRGLIKLMAPIDDLLKSLSKFWEDGIKFESIIMDLES